MANSYETPVLEPELAQWSIARHALHDEWLQSLRDSARRRLVWVAFDFRNRLFRLSREAGIPELPDNGLSGNPDEQPLMMTGHQPVIFHSGLTFKYETTEQYAAEQGAIGIAVVIDTDEGDAGAFSWPTAVSADSSLSGGSAAPLNVVDSRSAQDELVSILKTSSGTFSMGSALYAHSKKKSAEDIELLAKKVEADLRELGCDAVADRFLQRAAEYAKLPTDSMLEANLIVRWSSGSGARLAEICLSKICRFPEVIQFFGAILSRGFEFAECYNETLRTFRAEQKIRNEVNPFPSLEIASSHSELPFWIVDSQAGTRRVVSIHSRGGERTLETTDGFRIELPPGNETAAIFSLITSGCQLVPRGAMITAMLRLMFSDLFVHGTGGGRYDRYTSLLIRTWWQIEPTPFAVASASRYLFDDLRRQVAELQRISEQLRDLQFNPQRQFGTGLFSERTEQRLRDLLANKDAAIGQLQKARESGQSGREAGHIIQTAGNEIKAAVTAEFESRLEKLRAIPSESLAVINNRTWPWFFFTTGISFFFGGVL